MKTWLSELRISVVATLSLAVIVCGIYPLVVWGIAQVLFPHSANGSLMVQDGKIIGSELLAQNFTDPKYFILVRPVPGIQVMMARIPAAVTSGRSRKS